MPSWELPAWHCLPQRVRHNCCSDSATRCFHQCKASTASANVCKKGASISAAATHLPSCITQVQRDYEELPADAVPQLRDSLMQLLFKFGTGSPAVRTQLCLAIAALAAHLPAAQWGEGGVLRWLMNRFNGQDPTMAMSCMLELLTVLPQVRCRPFAACLHLAQNLCPTEGVA